MSYFGVEMLRSHYSGLILGVDLTKEVFLTYLG